MFHFANIEGGGVCLFPLFEKKSHYTLSVKKIGKLFQVNKTNRTMLRYQEGSS